MIAVGIVPILSAGIISISVKYAESVQWMKKLNGLLSGRIALGKSGYVNFGIKLLGKWVGGEPGEG